MKKLPVGRTIASVIAVLFISLGGYLLPFAHEMQQEFKQRKSLRPVDIKVDFSKTGDFVGKFHQTYAIVCGPCRTRFFLAVPQGTFGDAFTSDVTKQLRLDYTVNGPNEKDIWNNCSPSDENERDRLLSQFSSKEQLVELFSVSGFLLENSDYHLTINVVKGVPELAGIPQHLFVASEMCPCETLGLVACGLLILVSWSVAIILLGFVGVISIVKKKRKNRSE